MKGLTIAALGCATLTGCAEAPIPIAPAPAATAAYTAQDRECLVRAMYFESNRSSEDGLRAVGTVVMNRLASQKYTNSICGIVGQPGEFATGVLSRPMRPDEREKVERIADEVLSGKRETVIGDAMFFHEARLRFPYKNMHYMLVAGGNAFYEKR